jgi:hypothetical protein
MLIMLNSLTWVPEGVVTENAFHWSGSGTQHNRAHNIFCIPEAAPASILLRERGEDVFSILVTSWLCLPLAPLNPLEQDTLPIESLHLTAGLTTPSSAGAAGPEVSGKFELLAVHPVVVRGAVTYTYSGLQATLYPKGNSQSLRLTGALHGLSLGTDVLYYRGTNRLTGYVGLGLVYGQYFVAESPSSQSALNRRYEISDIGMAPALGYRLTLGLRYHRIYSLEVTVMEMRSRFQYTRVSGSSYASSDEPTRLGGFRISVGRLWTIR